MVFWSTGYWSILFREYMPFLLQDMGYSLGFGIWDIENYLGILENINFGIQDTCVNLCRDIGYGLLPYISLIRGLVKVFSLKPRNLLGFLEFKRLSKAHFRHAREKKKDFFL